MCVDHCVQNSRVVYMHTDYDQTLMVVIQHQVCQFCGSS